jgi:hypothetical protein
LDVEARLLPAKQIAFRELRIAPRLPKSIAPSPRQRRSRGPTANRHAKSAFLDVVVKSLTARLLFIIMRVFIAGLLLHSTSGDLLPAEAAALARVVKNYLQALAAHGFDERLTRLEEMRRLEEMAVGEPEPDRIIELPAGASTIG